MDSDALVYLFFITFYSINNHPPSPSAFRFLVSKAAPNHTFLKIIKTYCDNDSFPSFHCLRSYSEHVDLKGWSGGQMQTTWLWGGRRRWGAQAPPRCLVQKSHNTCSLRNRATQRL